MTATELEVDLGVAEELLADVRPPCRLQRIQHPNDDRPAVVAIIPVRQLPCGCRLPAQVVLLCRLCWDRLQANPRLLCKACFAPVSVLETIDRVEWL